MQPKYCLDNSEVLMMVIDNIQNLEFPTNIKNIPHAVKQAMNKRSELASLKKEEIELIVFQENKKQIELRFLNDMQNMLKDIEPELQKYPQHKSIQYLESIIYGYLDKEIYQPNVRISKIRNTLIGTTLEIDGMNTADRLFTELFIVLNELYQIMREHYGMEKEGKNSLFVFQCVLTFVENHSNCFLVLQDKKSFESESKIKTNYKSNGKDKQQNVLLDKKETIQKESSFRDSIQSLPNSALSIVGKIYDGIQSFNPLSEVNRELAKNEEQERQDKLNRVRESKNRVALDQESIDILEKLMEKDVNEIVSMLTENARSEFFELVLNINDEKVSSNLRLSKVEEIGEEIGIKFISCTDNINYSRKEEVFKDHKELIWIVLLYKYFEDKYHENSERRKWLMKFCDNSRIAEKVTNPFAVIKFIESTNMEESKIISLLRSMPLAEKRIEEKRSEPENKRIDEAQLVIDHELNRIHLYELKKKYDKEPFIEIEKLTTHKRKTITFLFSGFMSKDSCNVSKWEGLLSSFYDSEVYAVRWESKTTKEMMDYAFDSIKSIGAARSIGVVSNPYITAIAVLAGLYQKFNENPFNPAFDTAAITGEFFAELLMANFKGYFINLVGFSLGTEVIRSILERMSSKKCLNMLHKVYLMGGVADKLKVEKIIENSPVSLTIINLHSDCDYVLKYLLRLCKSDITPVGLNSIKQIEGHLIKNVDCSEMLQGHLENRSNLWYYCKELKIADD